ncbi:MAG TPA: chemotaxis protein CheB [Pirellulales bacterium]|nr:chemotaxis protein CheB [Pirellulales bacterium]
MSGPNNATDAVAPPLESKSTGDKQESCEPFHIVGIGASAGGLESLEQVFRYMPADTGMAFVVIQHLSPDFKSLMDELLARQTDIPVCRAEHEMTVEPNHIYLIPPRKEMIISGRKLLLTDKDPKQGLALPIDHFFRSLAQDAGHCAVGVVLSGSGSDGSRGIRDIHGAGGLVVSESLDTAKFDGMPLSAIETGVVDMVLPPAQIPQALVNHAQNLAAVESFADEHSSRGAHQGLPAIFDLLNREYGLDFSHYKSTTVGRRVQRRLSMHRIDDLDEYAERLRNDSDELNALYKDLLIGVTRFFRDREAFERLEREVLPEIIQKTPEDQEIRVWVVACATGEEAYSVAILLHELLEAAHRPVNAKVFATDVHRASLETASQGVYDEQALADVSESRLQRYFVHKSDGYHVGQDLRQMIVFAPHNILKDAPFTKLDLITCRNLLIYFQPLAQKKALSLFHFGLRTGGVLMLGPSETPGELSDEFETINEYWKVYSKRRDIALPADARQPLRSPELMRRTPLLASAPARAFPDTTLVGAYDWLLGRYMPPGLLVSERRELLHVFGGAEKFLRIKTGRPSADAFDLLDDDLKAAVTGAVQKVQRDMKPVHYSGIRLTAAGREALYRVSVEPIENRRSKSLHMFVSIIELEREGQAPPDGDGQMESLDADARQISRDRIEGLEAELRFTKENLQATIEELETSNEELQASNEELVASNEELQSTNEELHSVNEELYTVNAEYQKKISELTELHADMESLLASTEVGTIFLDSELRIRKFTPAVSRTFHLLPQDIGRRIDSFAHSILHETLVEDIEGVLSSGSSCEREVADRHGQNYLMRIFPYQTRKSIDGVVLTLIDISELKKAESLLNEAVRRRDQFLAMLSHELRNPLNAIVSAASLLEHGDGHPQLGRQSHEIIQRQSQHMARLLDELLDVSRVTQNKIQMRKRILNLADIVEDAVESVRQRIKEGRLEFTQRIAEEPLYISGDPSRLQQMLTNLLDNAAKYTLAGGRIWLSLHADGDDAVIRVKDTGIGIEPELLGGVFDLFVQTKHTLDRSSGGMGVGLTLVRSIVELHGGRVEAHSGGIGKGSEFVARLPRATAPAPSDASSGPPPFSADGRGNLIVVIEDEEDNRDMLKALLEAHGFDVFAAADGQEGIAAIERMRPAAALVDVGLPGINGYEVAQHVRRILGDDRTYLVALTGYGQAADVEQALGSGFDRHVVKPLSRDKLLEILGQRPPCDGKQPNAPRADN